MNYWTEERALGHITPGTDPWPEGEGFPQWLANTLDGTVLEFGCGTGRLAAGFHWVRYIGVDLSPHALARARKAAPLHDFRLVTDPLPKADAAFAHTVLLHIDDDELPQIVAHLAAAAPRVLVSEIMGRKWRRPGDPPVYNREPEDYVAAFDAAGMTMGWRWDFPYRRYGGVLFSVLEFVR